MTLATVTLSVRALRRQLRWDRLTSRDRRRLEERPTTRAECIDGPRPCPWISCSHHLASEVTSSGSLKLDAEYYAWVLSPHPDFPGAPVDTCLLDVVERNADGMKLNEIGAIVGKTRERVRQIEAVARLHLLAEREELTASQWCEACPSRRTERRDSVHWLPLCLEHLGAFAQSSYALVARRNGEGLGEALEAWLECRS